MIDTGESTSALGRVRAAVAGAVELGLKKKAAILAKALHQINAARQDGFSHAQIHVAITSGGLDLTPAYYENLYAREMRKHHARLAARPPVSQPAPGGLSPLIFGKLEKRPVELKMSESDATRLMNYAAHALSAARISANLSNARTNHEHCTHQSVR